MQFGLIIAITQHALLVIANMSRGKSSTDEDNITANPPDPNFYLWGNPRRPKLFPKPSLSGEPSGEKCLTRITHQNTASNVIHF